MSSSTYVAGIRPLLISRFSLPTIVPNFLSLQKFQSLVTHWFLFDSRVFLYNGTVEYYSLSAFSLRTSDDFILVEVKLSEFEIFKAACRNLYARTDYRRLLFLTLQTSFTTENINCCGSERIITVIIIKYNKITVNKIIRDPFLF